MLAFIVTLQSFIADRIERDDKGATAVEYGLMVALIGAVIVGTVTTLGLNLGDLFGDTAGDIGAVTP